MRAAETLPAARPLRGPCDERNTFVALQPLLRAGRSRGSRTNQTFLWRLLLSADGRAVDGRGVRAIHAAAGQGIGDHAFSDNRGPSVPAALTPIGHRGYNRQRTGSCPRKVAS